MKTFIVVLIILLSGQIALAADIQNLSENFPLSIEDAKPVEKNEFQLQFTTDYEKDDDYEFMFNPDIEYGIAKDVQLEFGAELTEGDSPQTGTGLTYLGALYKLPVNFTELAVKGTLLSGHEGQELDYELGLVSTLFLGTNLRTHLDLRWVHNNDAQPGERKEGYRTGFGVQHIYNDKTASLVSFVREIELEQNQEFNLIELACLHSLADNLSGAAALGIGIGDDSPDYTARLALQQGF